MASGAPVASDARPVRAAIGRVLRVVFGVFAVAMAIWIVVDLVRRGERMAHESLHWTSGFVMPSVAIPSGIGVDGEFAESYTALSEDFTVHVTSSQSVSSGDVRVFRDRSLCGDTVWPYPMGGGPSGLGEAFVWLEGVSTGSPHYPMDVSLSNGGCALYPKVSVTGVGSKLGMDNYLYASEVMRATHMDAGAQSTLDQWVMGDTVNYSYTADRHELTLDQPGLVKVQSVLRPWEVAFVLVCEHAYCGVGDWEGKIYLSSVPHGTYTLHAWHFLTGEVTQTLVVDSRVGGQEVTIDFP